MKAVILAAGEGIRMRPLTLNTPKPLLKVNGKPIIDYTLDSLPPEIDEVIIVSLYLAEQFKRHLGSKFRHLKIRHVEGSKKGSAYSFLATKKYLDDQRFMFAYGDDIPSPGDINNCLAKELSVLVYEPRNPSANGIVYLRKDGTISRIIEKPKKTKSKLAASGLMVLNSDIFKYGPAQVAGEFYFSAMVGLFAREHRVFAVPATNFIGEITTPDDLIRAEKILKNTKTLPV